jgi:hypothetical protein
MAAQALQVDIGGNVRMQEQCVCAVCTQLQHNLRWEQKLTNTAAGHAGM